MDLSFQRFEKDIAVTALPPDLAVLLVGITARQATSPTARLHQRQGDASPGDAPVMPPPGAFNADMAVALAKWKEE